MVEIITDEDFVFRRIPTHLPNYIKLDGTISSLAYQKKRDEVGVSADLERLSSYEKATLGDKRYRLLKINVGVIRNTINDGMNVIHDPQPNNDSHSLITGNISGGKQKQLLKYSTEVAA